MLSRAASLAVVSRHPLARAMVRAAEARGLAVTPAGGAREIAGAGIVWCGPDGEVRLGSRAFCAVTGDDNTGEAAPELWLAEPGGAPVRFAFADPLRADAADVVARLQAQDFRTLVLSGDRKAAVAAAASAAGIADWQAALTPDAKVARLQALADSGERVLMVGDGLNDAPALAAAFASASPATAADISQTASDVVFQGAKLAPVAEVITVAQAAGRLARQNLLLALGYNLITVPLAVAGYVTPLIAAIAMSSSSIVVTVNGLRLARRR
jgi:Cu2+-exporting ATPase